MLGAGWGKGDRQRGWREKSETNGVVGARGWQNAHHGLGSALLGGHLGAWARGAPGCRRTGPQGTHSDLCPLWPAEVAPRSKRRCVLERKQPYSGDEWCSGPDSEEDDKPIGATHSECPSMPGSCGPWCPGAGVCVCGMMAAQREPPSTHLGLQRSESEQGAGVRGPGYFSPVSPVALSLPAP